MKNKFIIATFISAFLLIAPNVKAANYTDYQTVDSSKTWTIKFTGEVGFDDSTKQDITVIDSKKNTINVSLKQGSDAKTVLVSVPQGGYTPGESYILDIGNKVHSKKGKALKNKYQIHFNVKSSTDVVTFKDKNLEQVVREIIKKPIGDIYKSDVEKITELNASTRNIQDISGIENLTNLKLLHLGINKITDISVLKGLINLELLDLSTNQISDISELKGLTNLQTLYLSYNQINDINALKGLINLKLLDLDKNQISDIRALEGLASLKLLDMYDNQIRDISTLRGLSNLQTLSLDKNQISDISALKELTSLQMLYLGGLGHNPISDDDKQSLKNALPKCNIVF